jgi:hypothetical protein
MLTRALAGIGPSTVMNGVTVAYLTLAVLRVEQPLAY